jgi:hypothetical protein
MRRRAAKPTQADVARAIRAAEQVAPGKMVVEITADGVIRILPHDGTPATGEAPLFVPKKEFVL